MVDLNKEEYVYLMIERTQKTGNIIDFNVHTFKTENDVKRAMLNIISNNAKNHNSSINYIAYSDRAIVNPNIVASIRIDFNSGIAKIYKAIRSRINEVK